MTLNLEKILLTVIRWGTYLILLTPLVVAKGFFFLFVGPKTVYFWGLTEIIFALWLFLVWFYPQYRPRRNLLLHSLIIFLACLVLSTIFGQDPSKSFWSNFERMTGLLTWFHLFAFFLVLITCFKEKKDWLKLFAVSMAVATVVSILSIFPKLGIPDILKNLPTQEGTTLGNTSFMAGFLLLNSFLALYLLFITASPRLKAFSAAAFVLISLALLASTGYAAIFSFFLGILLLFGGWLLLHRSPTIRLLGFAFLGVVVLAGIVLLFLIFQPTSVLYQTVIENFSKSRFIIWDIALKGWAERPLLGWGPENFDLVIYRYFHPCLFLPECSPRGEIWFDRAHNVLFDALATSGLLGLLSYLAIFISALYLLWRKHWKQEGDFWTVSVFSVGFAAYFIQNLTVFDMLNTYILFILLLAFITNLTKSPVTVPSFRPERTRFGTVMVSAIILVLFALSLFKFVIQPLRADYYAMAAVNSRDANKQLLLFQKTLRATKLGQYQIREFFADSLMNQRPSEVLRPGLDFMAGELQKSINSSPLNFRSLWKLGQLYNFYGRLDASKLSEAERVLQKAIAVSPNNQYGYWALAETEVALAQDKKAIALLQRAVELEPRLGLAHRQLVNTAARIGQLALAKQKAREAVKLVPALQAEFAQFLQP